MTPIAELIGKLERATGPDRELDEALIAFAEGAERVEDATFDHKHGYARGGFWVSIGPIHPVTASMDAALALAEKLLDDDEPVARYPLEISLTSVGHHPEAPWGCAVWTGSDKDGVFSRAPTAPLAILLAILRALSYQKPGNANG
jgi:hypothetical protein